MLLVIVRVREVPKDKKAHRNHAQSVPRGSLRSLEEVVL